MNRKIVHKNIECLIDLHRARFYDIFSFSTKGEAWTVVRTKLYTLMLNIELQDNLQEAIEIINE